VFGYVSWLISVVSGVFALQSERTFGAQQSPYALPLWQRIIIMLAELLVMTVFVVTGRWALRRAKRHLAPVLRSLNELPADQRIVLFLRSFSDDQGFAHQQLGKRNQPYLATTRTEEEQLAYAVRPFGRMVALGRPGDPLPQAGAARHYASDGGWRDQVHSGLDRSELVLLACGGGRSLRWEVEQVIAHGRPDRLVLVLTRDVKKYQKFRDSLGELFPKGLPDYRPVKLPEGVTDVYTRAAVWFEEDWTPHLEHAAKLRDGDFVKERLLVTTRQWVQTTFPLAIRQVYERAGVPWPGLENAPTARPRQLKAGLAVFAVCWAVLAVWLLPPLWTSALPVGLALTVVGLAVPGYAFYRTWQGGTFAYRTMLSIATASIAALLVFGALIAGGDTTRLVLSLLLAAGMVVGMVLLRRKEVGAWITTRLLDSPWVRRGAKFGKQQIIAGATAAAALLAVIGSAGYWLFGMAKASDTPMRTLVDLESGCYGSGGRRYFPQNDAYGGSGPHPIAVFLDDTSGNPNPLDASSSDGQDQPDYWNWDRGDLHRVQLIACLGEVEDGQFVTDCRFTSDTVPQYSGVYAVTVYEARTGREVGTERIAGDGKPDCPDMVFTEDKNPLLYTQPDITELHNLLAKYVE
jgi:hypothetical protein